MGCGLQLSMGCGEMFRSLHSQQGEEALSRKSHHVWHTPVVHQNPCGAQPTRPFPQACWKQRYDATTCGSCTAAGQESTASRQALMSISLILYMPQFGVASCMRCSTQAALTGPSSNSPNHNDCPALRHPLANAPLQHLQGHITTDTLSLPIQPQRNILHKDTAVALSQHVLTKAPPHSYRLCGQG